MKHSSLLLSPDYLPPLEEKTTGNSDKRLVTATLLAMVAVIASTGITLFTTRPASTPRIAEVTGGTGTVALSLSNPASVNAGESADLTLTADAGSSHLTAIQGELAYGDTCGTPTVTEGDFLTQTLQAASVANGKITFAYGAPTTSGGLTGSGTVATIHLIPTGECTVSFTQNTLAAVTESNANALKSASDATVTVAAASTPASASPSVSPSTSPNPNTCPTVVDYTESRADSIATYCNANGQNCSAKGMSYPTAISCHTGTAHDWTAYGDSCTAPNCSCTCVSTGTPTPTNAPSSPIFHQSCQNGNPNLSLTWTGDAGSGGYTVGIATSNSHGTYYTKPVSQGQSTDLTNFVGQSGDVSGKVFTFSLNTTYYAWVSNGKNSADSTFTVKDCNAAASASSTPAPTATPKPTATPTQRPTSKPSPTPTATSAPQPTVTSGVVITPAPTPGSLLNDIFGGSLPATDSGTSAAPNLFQKIYLGWQAIFTQIAKLIFH